MGETSVLSDSRAQSDQSVSPETFLSDWRAKPYKASDSGFAFKLVRSIDFFGTISGWRDEARRRDMGERNGATRFSERTSWTMLPRRKAGSAAHLIMPGHRTQEPHMRETGLAGPGVAGRKLARGVKRNGLTFSSPYALSCLWQPIRRRLLKTSTRQWSRPAWSIRIATSPLMRGSWVRIPLAEQMKSNSYATFLSL